MERGLATLEDFVDYVAQSFISEGINSSYTNSRDNFGKIIDNHVMQLHIDLYLN